MSKDGKQTSKPWHDECGVFGIWGDKEAASLASLGLYGQQHRGQESAGIVSLETDPNGLVHHHHHKGLGKVADVFAESDIARLKGKAAIGHVRYSTTGENLLTNAQPLTATLKDTPVAIAHNGNMVNAKALRKELVEKGAIFQGSNDTECLLHLLAQQPRGDFVEGLCVNLKKIDGAFSMVMLTKDGLFAMRDPYGFRPLAIGRRKGPNGDRSVVIASETCAFDLLEAEYVRDVQPGEVFWVDDKGEHSVHFGDKNHKWAQCIFEYIYFSRPDSIVFHNSVYEVRKELGAQLARENAVDADVVVPVPDSGVPAAIGYAQESKIPFELGIIRNHYVGRTFIEPKQTIRSFGVKLKLNPQAAVLKGKRVIVVDDSIVRGTTSQKIVQLIRQAGAIEVHLRISSPPTKGSCFYGVDTPTKEELIANNMSVEEIRKFIGADSLGYLSQEGLKGSVGGDRDRYCAACFDLKYPTKMPLE